MMQIGLRLMLRAHVTFSIVSIALWAVGCACAAASPGLPNDVTSDSSLAGDVGVLLSYDPPLLALRNGRLEPGSELSRLDFSHSIAALHRLRAFRNLPYSPQDSSTVDLPSDPGDAFSAGLAVTSGMLSLQNGRFNPGASATRADWVHSMATLLQSAGLRHSTGRRYNPVPDLARSSPLHPELCFLIDVGLIGCMFRLDAERPINRGFWATNVARLLRVFRTPLNGREQHPEILPETAVDPDLVIEEATSTQITECRTLISRGALVWGEAEALLPVTVTRLELAETFLRLSLVRELSGIEWSTPSRVSDQPELAELPPEHPDRAAVDFAWRAGIWNASQAPFGGAHPATRLHLAAWVARLLELTSTDSDKINPTPRPYDDVPRTSPAFGQLKLIDSLALPSPLQSPAHRFNGEKLITRPQLIRAVSALLGRLEKRSWLR